MVVFRVCAAASVADRSCRASAVMLCFRNHRRIFGSATGGASAGRKACKAFSIRRNARVRNSLATLTTLTALSPIGNFSGFESIFSRLVSGSTWKTWCVLDTSLSVVPRGSPVSDTGKYMSWNLAGTGCPPFTQSFIILSTEYPDLVSVSRPGNCLYQLWNFRSKSCFSVFILNFGFALFFLRRMFLLFVDRVVELEARSSTT